MKLFIMSLPEWVHIVMVILAMIMIVVLFTMLIKLILVVIYKVRHAERIEAGPTGVKIVDDEEDENNSKPSLSPPIKSENKPIGEEKRYD